MLLLVWCKCFIAGFYSLVRFLACKNWIYGSLVFTELANLKVNIKILRKNMRKRIMLVIVNFEGCVPRRF
jgi:hypothetical protein